MDLRLTGTHKSDLWVSTTWYRKGTFWRLWKEHISCSGNGIYTE